MIRLSHYFTAAGARDEAAEYLSATYLPLVLAMPHALRTEVARLAEQPLGTLHVQAAVEQYFEDEEAMQRSMASPAGRALARELMNSPRTAPELHVFAVEEASAR